MQGADGCIDDVGRRRPIRFADFEMDHVAAGVLELARRSQHFERAFTRQGGDSTGWNDGHVLDPLPPNENGRSSERPREAIP